MILDPEIKTLVDDVIKGQVEAMLGKAEGRMIEAKRQPYELSRKDQQIELAKDITAFANAAGGVLLIGYSTGKDEVHQEDVIVSINPIPLDRFNKTQYLQVLRNLTWPLVDVDIHVVKTNVDAGIVLLVVPPAEKEKRPILVTKYLPDDSQKTSDTIFGYYERTRSDNFAFDPKRLHAILRSGFFYEDHLRGEFEYLKSALTSASERDEIPLENRALGFPPQSNGTAVLFTPSTESTYHSNSFEIQSLVQSALHASQLADLPVMILVARPTRRLNLRRLFASRNEDLARLVESPPELRQAGFGLDSGGRSEIIAGRLRQSVEFGQSILEVHRDGTVIYAVAATEQGLAWGSARSQPPIWRINQVALLEKIYLFCLLVTRVADDPSAANISFDLAVLFKNLHKQETPIILKAGAIDRWGSGYSKSAPSSEEEIVEERIIPEIQPERAAYLLVARVYSWFGLDEDSIPYRTEIEGHPAIDLEAIRSLG